MRTAWHCVPRPHASMFDVSSLPTTLSTTSRMRLPMSSSLSSVATMSSPAASETIDMSCLCVLPLISCGHALKVGMWGASYGTGRGHGGGIIRGRDNVARTDVAVAVVVTVLAEAVRIQSGCCEPRWQRFASPSRTSPTLSYVSTM